MYTIGEVSALLDLPVSTHRYYDREGLLLNLSRDASGIRRFSDEDIDAIRMIEYLKKAGMQLRDIRVFMLWCKQGDETLEKRRDMFLEKREALEQQIRELEQTRDLLDFKCWYYTTAAAEGTDRRVRALSPEEMPVEVRRAFENSHTARACAGFAKKKKEPED